MLTSRSLTDEAERRSLRPREAEHPGRQLGRLVQRVDSPRKRGLEARHAWSGLAFRKDPRASRGRLRGWLDEPADDPAVLADLAVADESKLLVGRQGAVEEKAGRNRTRGLGIALHLAAAETCDQIERPIDRRRGDALAPVPLPTKLQATRQFGKVVRPFS